MSQEWRDGSEQCGEGDGLGVGRRGLKGEIEGWNKGGLEEESMSVGRKMERGGEYQGRKE